MEIINEEKELEPWTQEINGIKFDMNMVMRSLVNGEVMEEAVISGAVHTSYEYFDIENEALPDEEKVASNIWVDIYAGYKAFNTNLKPVIFREMLKATENIFLFPIPFGYHWVLVGYNLELN